MTGFDEHNTILLPPREPGGKLPPELTDHYEEQMKKLEEAERARREQEGGFFVPASFGHHFSADIRCHTEFIFGQFRLFA